MAYITEDRKISGLNLIASVKDNISIAYMDMVTKGKFLIDFKKEKKMQMNLSKKLKSSVHLEILWQERFPVEISRKL